MSLQQFTGLATLRVFRGQRDPRLSFGFRMTAPLRSLCNVIEMEKLNLASVKSHETINQGTRDRAQCRNGRSLFPFEWNFPGDRQFFVLAKIPAVFALWRLLSPAIASLSFGGMNQHLFRFAKDAKLSVGA